MLTNNNVCLQLFKYSYIFFDNHMIKMDIFSFGVEFGTEEDCLLHFKKGRDKLAFLVNMGKQIFIGLRAD